MSEITEQMKQWVKEQREIEKKEVEQENITPVNDKEAVDMLCRAVLLGICIVWFCWAIGLF